MVLFWISVILILYVYGGYLLIFYIIGSTKKPPDKTSAGEPMVTLVISTCNEEEIIDKKIRNSLELAYPKERLQIIVVSDASTDRTDKVVDWFLDQGVELRRQPERMGKNAGLNAVVPWARGEIIVFSNADTTLPPNTLRALVGAFADEKVGCVCGDKVYADRVGESEENLYQRYKRLLKTWKSRAGVMIGAEGAVFAVRKSLYTQLADDDWTDLAVPLDVSLAGFRAVFVEDAVTYEVAASTGSVFHIKSRMVKNRFATVFRRTKALNPIKYPLLAFELFSYRILRRLVGVFMIIAFFSNIFVLEYSLFYRLTLSAQILFYLLATTGLLLKGDLRKRSIFSMPAHFCLANTSALAGIFNYLMGRE